MSHPSDQWKDNPAQFLKDLMGLELEPWQVTAINTFMTYSGKCVVQHLDRNTIMDALKNAD